MSLSTQRFCRNFFKATAPGVLHHWAGPCTWWAWPLWWFRLFPWPRPGPGSWMSRWISSTNPKWQTTRCCRNRKPTTWWMDVSPCSRVPEAQPAAVPAPSRRRCRSGCSPGRLYLWCCWHESRRRGPAEVARGKGQVDSRPMGVSLQLFCIMHCQLDMSGTNIHKGRAKIVDMSDPHVTIQSNPLYSTHFMSFAWWFASTFFQQFIARSLTAIPFQRKHIQKPHTPSGKWMKFPKGRWTSKLLRLRSLQVDPPIHSTKKDLNVLAKTDSLKTQKSLLRTPRKRQNLREWCPSAVFDWIPPTCHTPSTAPQPWPCCGVSAFTPSSPIWFPNRPTSFMVLLTRNASARACRVGTRQRPSGQQTRGRFTAAVLNYLHCQLAVPHVKIVTRAHSCQILTSPSNPLYSTHFITFARWFASTFFQQFIARSLTAIPFQRKHIQKPHTPSGKWMKFPKGRWTSKLLRLRSLQVDPPIHSTKKDLNVLAKTDSLKTQKSLLRTPRKRQNLREWCPSAVFDWIPPTCHTPSTAPQPWPCCGVSAFTPSLPIWLFLRLTVCMVLLTRNASARACRVGTRQRPSGQ